MKSLIPAKQCWHLRKKISILSREYSNMNPKFNAEKSEVVLFNMRQVLERFKCDLDGESVASKLEEIY